MNCIETLLEIGNRVYIDTSALMDVEYLELLIVRVKVKLIEVNKKIIVPKAVWMELKKHIDSNNAEKQIKAAKAIELVCSNREMFYIEDKDIDPDEVLKVFADKELLVRLIHNKSKCPQLLITNDKNLSKDAYTLNQQESCLGHHISVCYLASNGDLRECECIKSIEAKNSDSVEAVVISSEPDKHMGLKFIGTSLLSTIAGIVIGKYAPKIMKLI